MLSATPVNNRFNDLKNQLALAYEGHTDYIDEKLSTNRTMMKYSGTPRELLILGVSGNRATVQLKTYLKCLTLISLKSWTA